MQKIIRCSLCDRVVIGSINRIAPCTCGVTWRFRKMYAYAEANDKVYTKEYDNQNGTVDQNCETSAYDNP